ncbi:MAG: response regulator [Elusimicrobia bacterium]|nr:response regulator [Elusimicrobiota bacterium]
MKIIIADDDENLISMIVPHLKFLGHEVVCVPNGAELLKKVKEIRVELIISDINMPDIDGKETFKKLRAMVEYVDVPVILISGLEIKEGEELEVASQKMKFIKKPFGLAVLEAAIKEFSAPKIMDDFDGPGDIPQIKE